jgi:hypothetical protein
MASGGMTREALEFCTGTSPTHGGGCDGNSAMIAMFMLSVQESLGIQGNLCEIGVKQGRYLILLKCHQRAGETVFAIDPQSNHPELIEEVPRNMETYSGNRDGLVYLAKRSEDVTPDQLRVDGRGLRYVHVDGNHDEDGVWRDLKLVEQVVMPGAIIVLDDYFYGLAPGVSAGLFRYLQEEGGRKLVPFFSGGPKFYLTTDRNYAGAYHTAFRTAYREEIRQRPIFFKKWLGYDMVAADLTRKHPTVFLDRDVSGEDELWPDRK